MMLVVDASVATKWLFFEEQSRLALELARTERMLLAPDFVLMELAASISKRIGRGEIDQAEGLRRFETVPRLFSRLAPTAPLITQAIALAQELHHQLYDCLYLALAQRERAAMVTADAKLLKKIAGTRFTASVVSLADI